MITKQDLKRVQVLMDPKLFQQLRRYAFDNESSYCEVARRALKLFLEEERNLISGRSGKEDIPKE